MTRAAAVLVALLSADIVMPEGTRIPVRLLERITSGRDHVGTVLLVKTKGHGIRVPAGTTMTADSSATSTAAARVTAPPESVPRFETGRRP